MKILKKLKKKSKSDLAYILKDEKAMFLVAVSNSIYMTNII